MKIVIAAAFIVSGLLVGCNQLTQYTVSEQEINQALENIIIFQKTLVCRGLPMRISSSATSPARLGAKSRIKSLAGDANLDMTSLFGNQKANIKLKLKALPVFNKEKGAIFLQEMEVVDADVTPDKMKPVMQTLMPYLNQSLRNYFNQQPAYVLSEDKSKGEALAKNMPKALR